MKRYKELKYEGNVYEQSYKIDEILIKQGFSWFLDCEVENMRLEILKETLIINAGCFFNGCFEYGVIRDCDIRSGSITNGVIYNGKYKNFTIKNGIVFNGNFINCNMIAGSIKGGNFIDCEISNTVKREKTENQSQEQVQQPVQENYIIKRFKYFHI